MPDLTIEEVFDANVDALMGAPGVVGVGIGESNGRPCIRVMVEAATPAVLAGLPTELGGYAVLPDETGPINALDPGNPPNPTR